MRSPFTALPLLLLLAPTAQAGLTVTGDALQISYNDQGTWNAPIDPDAAAPTYTGLTALLGGEWVEFTGQGTPWQDVVVSYTSGGSTASYVGSPFNSASSWNLTRESDASTTDFAVAEHGANAGLIAVTKTETWASDGSVVFITLKLRNTGSGTLTDVTTLFLVDPDQDYDRSTTVEEETRTQNDSLDLNGDGTRDYAQSVGKTSGYTLALGLCDPTREEVGHSAAPSSLTDVDLPLSDLADVHSDVLIGWRHVTASLTAGEEVAVRLLAIVAENETLAQEDYLTSLPTCQTCDADGDGFDSLACGGTDCDDADDAVNPDAEELNNGEDDNCNGYTELDDFDRDGVLDEIEIELGLDPRDPDSDGDGVPDDDELGDPNAPTDTDGDGVIDALDTDDDGDGVLTSIEGTTDADADGVPNYRDVDDDGDGIPTEIEGQSDADGDGTGNYLDRDSDDDGLLDSLEGAVDTDGDGVSDYLDTDSDDDGKLDLEEQTGDLDCDEVVNYVDADDDDGPCGSGAFDDFRGGGGLVCGTVSRGAGLGWLAVSLAAALARRRRR